MNAGLSNCADAMLFAICGYVEQITLGPLCPSKGCGSSGSGRKRRHFFDSQVIGRTAGGEGLTAGEHDAITCRETLAAL